MPWPSLLQDLPDEPHMTKRVQQGTVEHPLDRMRARGHVSMFTDGISLNSSGRQSAPVHRDGIVHKELDSHSVKPAEAGPHVP
jgi:hypothetical protein